jgi:hypothetical protein
MKTAAIIQSSYIPWKGYFDIIGAVDELILYDDAQYTKNDWRNRNRVKTQHGLRWLTIPVSTSGRWPLPIRDVEVDPAAWADRHWKTLAQSYARADGFAAFGPHFEAVYASLTERTLSDVNHRFITEVCGLLGIQTRITRSMEYRLVDGRNERLVDLCRQVGADVYLSGPSASAYLDEELFAASGIAVRYVDYSGYPEYAQPHPPFEHAVSILDLLFSVGPKARTFMKSL